MCRDMETEWIVLYSDPQFFEGRQPIKSQQNSQGLNGCMSVSTTCWK